MRKYLILALTILGCFGAHAQQIEFGLRDNQFIRADFIVAIANNEYHAYIMGWEQSLLNVKMKEQSGRIFAGYRYTKSNFLAKAIIYGGTEYDRRWQVFGTLLNGLYRWNYFGVGASLNPNYDTNLGFQLNYDIETSITVLKESIVSFGLQQVEVTASFGNIPEYRDNIQNMRVGLKFTSGNLWVHPEVCIPGFGDKDRTSNRIRVLCNMGWNFKFKNRNR